MGALFHREKTGRGQIVECSLLGSALWSNALDTMASIIEQQRIPKIPRSEAGNPLWNMYQTQDGRWLHLIMLQTDRYWSAFCQAIGRADLEKDPRFDNHENRCENNKALIPILDEVFKTRTLEEWTLVMDSFGEVLWAPIQEPFDLATDPQVLANEYLVDVQHPSHGHMKLVASPIKFSETPTEIRNTAPELGQNTEEVLLGMGYSWDDIALFKDEGVIL